MNLAHLATYPAPIRIGAFLLVLLVLWLPMVGLAYWLLADQNTISIVVMTLLFLEFVGLLKLWGRQIYGHPALLKRYGLARTRQNFQELVVGLLIGCASLFSLFITESVLGWARWQVPSLNVIGTGLEGLAIALGVGFGEELIFRGWLLDELERDYSAAFSLWLDSLIFAGLHYIKSVEEMLRTFPQFPGLVLLGVALVWAKRSTLGKRTPHGRLGLSIGLHAGLVWGYYVVNVGNLIQYTHQVPEWLTGIDRNPLAGITGLLFLSLIAIGMRIRMQQARKGTNSNLSRS